MTSASSALAFVPGLLAGWPADAPAHQAIDASLVFVDVSGFTALSERLARRGPIGAELLGEVLDVVFGRMLAVAETSGGELLKYGGDAMLLMFRGEEHELRSAVVAREIQRALSRRVAVDGLGSLRLGASMGIAAGEVHAAAVGRDRSELVVFGPVVDEVLAAESRAEAGQVLVTERVRRALGRHGLPAAADVLDLAAAVVPFPGPVAPPPNPGRAHELGFWHLGPAAEPPMAGHRVVVSGFVRFAGLAGRPVEEAVGALDRLVESAQQVASHHELHITCIDIAPDGGKVLLTAGGVTDQADGAERVIAAALSMVEADPGLGLACGIAAGKVYVGELGSPTQRVVAVIGDPVNTAARLAARTPTGRVAVVEATLSAADAAFHYEPMEPFAAKGKRRPVRAGTVRPVDRPDERAYGPLLGRGREAELLTALARRAADALVPTIGVVEGPPGQGKSHLVGELRRRLSGFRVVEAGGGRYAALSSFRLIGAVLDSIVEGDLDGFLRRHDAVVAGRDAVARLPFGSGGPGGAPVDPGVDAAAAGAVWADLLGAAMTDPIAVIIEDSHWTDSASSTMLDVIFGRLRSCPLAVIVTRRPGVEGWTPRRVDERVVLGPLDPDEARALVAAWSDTMPLPTAVIDKVVERAQGNPLFLHELVRAAASDSDLPPTVEAVVGDAVASMDRESRDLAVAAAVLGASTSVAVLAALVGQEESRLAHRLGTMQRFLTFDGDVVRFQHALVRDAAYRSCTFRHRRRLHADAARLLTRMDAATELIAIHLSESGEAEAAWVGCLDAAAQAEARGASREALEFLDRALKAGRALRLGDDVVLPVLRRAGEACLGSGQPARALGYARRGKSRRPTPDLLLVEGRALVQLGRYGPALRILERAERAVAAGPREQRELAALIVIELASMRYRQGRLERSLELHERAASLAIDVGDRPTLARAYKVLGTLRDELGLPEDSEYLRRALALYRELQDRRGEGAVLNNMAVAAHVRGDWVVARLRYEEALAAFHESGAVEDEYEPTHNLGELLLEQGRLDDAEPLLRLAEREFRAGGFEWHAAYAAANVALLDARAGRIEVARPRVDAAIDRLRAIGAGYPLALAALNRYEIDLLAGDAPDASALEPLVSEARDPSLGARLHRLAAISAMRQGDASGVDEHLAASLRLAEHNDLRAERLFTLQARAVLRPSPGEADPSPELRADLGVVRSPVVAIVNLDHAAGLPLG